MHGDSPYLIMFGPDICGPGTKKVSPENVLFQSLNYFLILILNFTEI